MIEEQHVTQCESIIDSNQTWLEQWLMHELMEVYNYYGCVQQESQLRIKALWERFLDYELGQLKFVMELFNSTSGGTRWKSRLSVSPIPFLFPASATSYAKSCCGKWICGRGARNTLTSNRKVKPRANIVSA